MSGFFEGMLNENGHEGGYERQRREREADMNENAWKSATLLLGMQMGVVPKNIVLRVFNIDEKTLDAVMEAAVHTSQRLAMEGLIARITEGDIDAPDDTVEDEDALRRAYEEVQKTIEDIDTPPETGFLRDSE